MQRNRRVQNVRDLTRGPGRLAAALDVDRRLDGVDLCRMGPLRLARDDHAAPDMGVSRRIGLSRETDRLLRFYARGNPFVIARVFARLRACGNVQSRSKDSTRDAGHRSSFFPISTRKGVTGHLQAL